MIARTWRGVTRADDADAYVEYLNRTGFAEDSATPGNAGVLGLRRVCGDRAEFLLLSLWDDPEPVTRFTSSDPARVVFYAEDDAYLADRDEHVDYYEVIHQQWRFGARGEPRNWIQTLLRRVNRWGRGQRPTAVTDTNRNMPPRPAERGWTLIGIR